MARGPNDRQTKYDVMQFPVDAFDLDEPGVLFRDGYENLKERFDEFRNHGYEIFQFSVDSGIAYIMFQR